MKQSEPLAMIQHKYYCKVCYKHSSFTMSCHDKPPLSIELECPYCQQKAMKYQGGFDCRVTTTGNCGYESFEKGSDRNIKRIGQDGLDAMIAADPVAKHRKESAAKAKDLWWRQGLENPAKPLDLSKIKDTEKYIQTGKTD